MATIKICDFITAFQEGDHIATSYQFYNGVTNDLIDESIYNTEKLIEWNSQLYDGNGGHFKNLSDLRARVMIHYGDGSDSGWLELGGYDQTDPLQPINSCII